MKSVSELTDFYYKALYPTLERLEKKRKALSHRIIYSYIILGTLALLIGSALRELFSDSPDAIGFFLALLLAIAVFLYKLLSKGYIEQFKKGVMHPLVKEAHNGLEYRCDAFISEARYEASELFSHADRYGGNDYISGSIEGVKIEFSDIHAQKEHRDSKGRKSYSTIFQGVFIVTEFHKHFIGKTFILPDSAQKSFGDLIGSWLQSKNPMRGELIKMDDAAFEREFVVYGSDQIEARYILSHAVMQRLLEFRRKSRHPISLSFVNAQMYIAIHYGKDMFEPSIFTSLLKHSLAMEYIQNLTLLVGLINELKLNQKLWSKHE